MRIMHRFWKGSWRRRIRSRNVTARPRSRSRMNGMLTHSRFKRNHSRVMHLLPRGRELERRHIKRSSSSIVMHLPPGGRELERRHIKRSSSRWVLHVLLWWVHHEGDTRQQQQHYRIKRYVWHNRYESVCLTSYTYFILISVQSVLAQTAASSVCRVAIWQCGEFYVNLFWYLTPHA
jgi:hypothetical protein